MARRRIKKRWWLLIAVACAIGIAVVVPSHVLRYQMTSLLENLSGGAVEIGSVSPGLRWHVARDVRIRSQELGDPWLEVDEVRFELPLSTILGGQLMPHQVQLTRPQIALRFDKQGELVEPMLPVREAAELRTPSVEVTGARLSLHRSGRSTIVLDDVAGTLESDEAMLIVAAQMTSSPLGPWSLDATYDLASGVAQSNLASDRLSFDSNALPELVTELIPQSLEDLDKFNATIGTVRGVAHAKVSLTVGTDRPLEYHAELDVSAAELRDADGVPQLTEGAGRIVLSDGVLALSGFRSRYQGGQVAVDGKLDLQSRESIGQLSAQVSGIEWSSKLPWARQVPDLSGIVSGAVQLDVKGGERGWIVSGQAKGHMQDAAWTGTPMETLTATFDLERWPLAVSAPVGPLEGSLHLDFGVAEVEWALLATRWLPPGNELADSVSGRVSVEGQLHVPLSSVRDLATYRGAATLHCESLALASTRCGPWTAKVTLLQGLARLEKTVLQLQPKGLVVAQGVAEIAPPGACSLELELDRLSAGMLQPYLEGADQLSGDVHATLTVANPDWSNGQLAPRTQVAPGTARTPWRVSGHIDADALSWEGMALKQIAADVDFQNRELQVLDLRCHWSDALWKGSATCLAKQPYTFDLKLAASQLQLERAAAAAGLQLAMPVAGAVRVRAHAAGSLAPLRWTGDGSIDAERVDLRDVSVSQVRLPWTIKGDVVTFGEASAQVLGGAVQVSGTVPLRDVAASHLEGRFDEIDAKAVSRLIALDSVSFHGTGSGRFSVEHVLSPKLLDAELEFSGVGAVTKKVEFGKLAGRIDVHQGAANLQVKSELLKGTCSFEGHAQVDAAGWKLSQMRGKAEVRQVQLQRLWSFIGQQQRLGSLQAVGNAELDVQWADWGAPPTARGEMKLSQVRWARTPLADELSAEVALQGDQLKINNARFRLDRGAVIGQATINATNGRGEFQLRAEQVPLRSLLAFAPNVARNSRGNIEGEMKGVLGERWTANGVLRIDRGDLAGVPVSGVRMPLRISRVPDSGRTQVDVELQSARIATGRAKGRCHAWWSGQFGFEATGELTAANLRPIAKAVPGVSNLLGGQISGSVDIKSTNLRAVEDLVGKFDVQLKQSQTLLLPGFGELTSALGAASPGALTFVETGFQGEVRRGTIWLKQMSMESAQARMWASGKLDLRGTMDIDVAADPGSLSTINLVAATVNPLALLRRRLVFVHLSGSLRNPVVQPSADQFLAQELVFFFVPVVSLR